MAQTTIRIPEELHRSIRQRAKKKGLTVNAFVIQILWEAISK